jgi:CRP-like cAMP-binding protein
MNQLSVVRCTNMANIKSELKQGLAKTMWAHMLAPDHMQKVEDEIIERFIPAGGYVCRKGDPVDHWMGVLDGFLKMSSISPEGKTVTFSCMLAGGWFGEGSLLKTEPRRYDVVACVIPASRICRAAPSLFCWITVFHSIAFFCIS